MKLKAFVSAVCVLCAFSVSAEEAQPSWFVVKDNPAFVEDTEVVVEEKTEVKEETVQEEVVAEEASVDKLRFARNSKDLNLAKDWLQFEFNKNGAENIIVSPLSLYNVSVLLANGVVDETLFDFSKLFSVLHLNEVNQKIKEYDQAKLGNIHIYNSLWGKYFSERYQSLMKEKFGVEIWGLADTTDSINNWISVRTKGEIKEMAPVVKTEKDELFLAGAIYFNDSWELSFGEKNIKKMSFHNLNGQKSKIVMLNTVADVDYYENEKVQAVRLFYEKGDYMTIFLPKEDVAFSDFVNQLTVQDLKPLFSRKKDVALTIPRFDVEYGLKTAKDIFEKQGIRKIFEKDNFDFAKMVSYDMPTFIEDVYFKTKLKVDENKTEAVTDLDNGKVIFKANRPFIFMINNGDFIGSFVQGNE